VAVVVRYYSTTANQEGRVGETYTVRIKKEFSGQFVIRIPPKLHRDLVVKAAQEGKSLNTLVVEILTEAMEG
jgi:predicted HicB family RNase H-like nuclease